MICLSGASEGFGLAYAAPNAPRRCSDRPKQRRRCPPHLTTGVRDDIFAIVFGESVLNDAVAIVLARTVLTFNHPAAEEGGAAAAALALLIFVGIFLGSTAIGGIAGALSALTFKALRISERPNTQVVEASLSFAFPWAACLPIWGLAPSDQQQAHAPSLLCSRVPPLHRGQSTPRRRSASRWSARNDSCPRSR